MRPSTTTGSWAQIFLRLRELYRKEGGAFPDPILNLTWDYADPNEPKPAELAKEINGKALADLHDPKDKSKVVVPRPASRC